MGALRATRRARSVSILAEALTAVQSRMGEVADFGLVPISRLVGIDV